MQKVVGLALEEEEKVVVMQNKHAKTCLEMQLNELVYDLKQLWPPIQVVKLNCHRPYNIGIDDLHHDDVKKNLSERCVHHVASHVDDAHYVDGEYCVDAFRKIDFVLKLEK